MVNFIINFIKNNIITLSLLLFIIIVLFVALRKFRKIVYAFSGIIVLSFILAITYKTYGIFEISYNFITKLIYKITTLISKIQDILVKDKEIITLSSYFLIYTDVKYYDYYELDINYNFMYSFYLNNIKYVISNIKLKLYNTKNSLLNNINISRKQLVYRV